MNDFKPRDGERLFGSDLPKGKNENVIVESFSKDTPLWKIQENMPAGAKLEERDGKYVVTTPIENEETRHIR